MKRIAIVLAGLLVLGGRLAASLKAGGGKKGVRVYAEAAARRDIQQVVKATGEINPRIKVNISAHVVAKIEKLFVNEGDWIEKGQPFLRLEQNVFVADRDQWAAQLRSAETAVRRQEVALADTASKLRRAQLLYNGGSLTAAAPSASTPAPPPPRSSGRPRSSQTPPPACSSRRPGTWSARTARTSCAPRPISARPSSTRRSAARSSRSTPRKARWWCPAP